MVFARHFCLALLSLTSMLLSVRTMASTSTVDSRDVRIQLQMGEHVFKERCMVCHGVNADGKSELAKLMKPPPANLRVSALSPTQKSTIVRKGGEAVGRSPNMPTWEQELNEAELNAVLVYLGHVQSSSSKVEQTASDQKHP